jgi:hypothetical protein
MPDLDFSAPSYAAIAHDSRKNPRPKRNPAPVTVDGEAVGASKGRAAAKPSKADKLYRKSAKR